MLADCASVLKSILMLRIFLFGRDTYKSIFIKYTF
jgi:hypothetical protein